MVGEKKKRIKLSDAWREAKGLIIVYHSRLALGALLMLINRLAGLVLPASSKYIIDEVVVKGRRELLMPIALIAGAATLLQIVASFSLSRIFGIAAQRTIIELRKKVQAHVDRLPICYFDSTQTGKLVSRIMTDAEGVRNLVGTGLIRLSVQQYIYVEGTIRWRDSDNTPPSARMISSPQSCPICKLLKAADL